MKTIGISIGMKNPSLFSGERNQETNLKINTPKKNQS